MICVSVGRNSAGDLALRARELIPLQRGQAIKRPLCPAVAAICPRIQTANGITVGCLVVKVSLTKVGELCWLNLPFAAPGPPVQSSFSYEKFNLIHQENKFRSSLHSA
jgi:hypothetical protein